MARGWIGGIWCLSCERGWRCADIVCLSDRTCNAVDSAARSSATSAPNGYRFSGQSEIATAPLRSLSMGEPRPESFAT